jgi:hypothetical protein
MLISGGVTAFWSSANGSEPRPGHARLRGYLVGTVHGAIPDQFPRVTGLVQRIQVISERFVRGERNGHPAWERVPGSLTLTEVTRGPRWFSAPWDPDGTLVETCMQTGVLLDMLVDHRSP